MISSAGRQDSRAVCITNFSVAPLRLSVEARNLESLLEDLPKLSEASEFQQVLPGLRLIDDLVFQHPRKVMRNEDGV